MGRYEGYVGVYMVRNMTHMENVNMELVRQRYGGVLRRSKMLKKRSKPQSPQVVFSFYLEPVTELLFEKQPLVTALLGALYNIGLFRWGTVLQTTIGSTFYH